MNAQQRKRKASIRRVLGDRYTKDSYGRAIQRGCDRAFAAPDEMKQDPEALKAWRKNLEAARCMLGHKMSAVTEIYASEFDEAKAAEISAKIW